jgi:uncharacterized protein YdhG (YjbR/CyaY superfamily)
LHAERTLSILPTYTPDRRVQKDRKTEELISLLKNFLKKSIPVNSKTMQSKTTTVNEYLKEVPSDRLEALKRIRKLCRVELKGYDESMRYGMPSYEKNGIVEIAFNSQKNYIALYILKTDVLKKYLGDLKGLNVGKSCIRYTKPEKIDFSVIQKMLGDARSSTQMVC